MEKTDLIHFDAVGTTGGTGTNNVETEQQQPEIKTETTTTIPSSPLVTLIVPPSSPVVEKKIPVPQQPPANILMIYWQKSSTDFLMKLENDFDCNTTDIYWFYQEIPNEKQRVNDVPIDIYLSTKWFLSQSKDQSRRREYIPYRGIQELESLAFFYAGQLTREFQNSGGEQKIYQIYSPDVLFVGLLDSIIKKSRLASFLIEISAEEEEQQHHHTIRKNKLTQGQFANVYDRLKKMQYLGKLPRNMEMLYRVLANSCNLTDSELCDQAIERLISQDRLIVDNPQNKKSLIQFNLEGKLDTREEEKEKVAAPTFVKRFMDPSSIDYSPEKSLSYMEEGDEDEDEEETSFVEDEEAAEEENDNPIYFDLTRRKRNLFFPDNVVRQLMFGKDNNSKVITSFFHPSFSPIVKPSTKFISSKTRRY